MQTRCINFLWALISGRIIKGESRVARMIAVRAHFRPRRVSHRRRIGGFLLGPFARVVASLCERKEKSKRDRGREILADSFLAEASHRIFMLRKDRVRGRILCQFPFVHMYMFIEVSVIL